MSISGELCRKLGNWESNDNENALRFELARRLIGAPPGMQVQAVDGGLSIHPHPPLVISRPRQGPGVLSPVGMGWPVGFWNLAG